MLARLCDDVLMSEEGYIKAPCHECQGRISLPQDAVGVDFNCPHCGAGLQMLLKHTCDHCGGRLSFDGTPEAIGMEIECGHCHNSTVLQPSTFTMDGAGAAAQPAAEEDFKEGEYEEEEYEEEEYEEEEYEDEEYEDENEEAEPETVTRRRTGPPKPRTPKRAGPPKPRQPKKAGQRGGNRPGQPPERIGRRLAGAEPVEEESADGRRRKRPRPKRRAGSGEPRPGAARRPMAGATQQLDEDPSDPMSGDLPGGSPVATPSPTSPPGSAPVQRKVAGASPAGESQAAASPQPTFKAAPSEEVEEFEGDEEPWHKNKEKKKLAIAGGVFLAVLLLVGLPGLDVYPSPISALFGSGYRSNTTDQIKFDDESFKIEADPKNKTVYYITGTVQNQSSETLEQVELRFLLYDASGMKLGETLDFTNKLGPNMEWHFRAVSMFTNVARVDLAGVVVR
jgi:hypothetical protein